MSAFYSRSIIPAFMLLLVSTSAPAWGAETIRINGTGCGMALMKPLIAAFQKKHKDVNFEVQKSLGSAAALKAIAKGALDVAVPGRALKPHEASPNLSWFEYGKTPYAVVTHRNTSLEDVSTEQLAAIYDGTRGKWPNGDFIRVVLRPQDDIDTTVLRSLSPEMDRAVSAAHARPDMLMGVTDQETFDHLKKTAGTISFAPLSMALSEPGAVNLSHLNGIAPTLANVANGRYPYTKKILVVTRKEPSPGVKAFVQFLNSKGARALVTRQGLLLSAGK